MAGRGTRPTDGTLARRPARSAAVVGTEAVDRPGPAARDAGPASHRPGGHAGGPPRPRRARSRLGRRRGPAPTARLRRPRSAPPCSTSATSPASAPCGPASRSSSSGSTRGRPRPTSPAEVVARLVARAHRLLDAARHHAVQSQHRHPPARRGAATSTRGRDDRVAGAATAVRVAMIGDAAAGADDVLLPAVPGRPRRPPTTVDPSGRWARERADPPRATAGAEVTCRPQTEADPSAWRRRPASDSRGRRRARQAAEAETRAAVGSGRATGAVSASVSATRSETCPSTSESGRCRAPQMEASSSEEASFSPRSTSLR